MSLVKLKKMIKSKKLFYFEPLTIALSKPGKVTGLPDYIIFLICSRGNVLF